MMGMILSRGGLARDGMKQAEAIGPPADTYGVRLFDVRCSAPDRVGETGKGFDGT